MPRPHLPQRLHTLPGRLKHSSNTNGNGNGNNTSNGNGNSTNPSQPTSAGPISSLPPSTVPSRSTSPKPPSSSQSSQIHNPAMGDHRGGGVILRVSVLKARDLAPKDKSGKSDPYLVLTLGDVRESTVSIPKNLNPEWNETFEMPILGEAGLLLECVCWDKDRFGKDYMGEFDVPVEDLFAEGRTTVEPRWYRLESRKTGRKKSVVTGEVLLGFALYDPVNAGATGQQVLSKLSGLTASSPGGESITEEELNRMNTDELSALEDDDEEEEEVEGTSESTDDNGKRTDTAEKKRRRIRIAKLKKKKQQRSYEFSGSSGSGVAGVLFLELTKVTDLPPHKNMTRTSFDMDPFVVTSLGKKTYRTRVIRHNLNPVYEEKLVFQVMKHEINYSLNFAVVDRDKLSGNDFIGTTDMPLQEVVSNCPDPDPNTGLYRLPEPPDSISMSTTSESSRKSRFKLGMSRSSSASSLTRLARPGLKKESSQSSLSGYMSDLPTPPLNSNNNNSGPLLSVPPNNNSNVTSAPQDSQQQLPVDHVEPVDDPDLKSYEIPLTLKNKEKWEAKHKPILYLRAKYMPYQALRQQFWRAMLKQYDADDSGHWSKVELTTMLDTLGSTLHEDTIDGFFKRFDTEYLTADQAVICLEDQLKRTENNPHRHHHHSKLADYLPAGTKMSLTANADRKRAGFTTGDDSSAPSGTQTPMSASGLDTPINQNPSMESVPALQPEHMGDKGEEGDLLGNDDLAGNDSEEHVVEIRECPICHQPRLNKKSDSDIITHVATCASQDWRQVNNIVMAGFVTSSQAQRKWYSKVITKISYGNYKVGANSANILVQDRITGQINEERMSVYVRLGIRLLYKGLKSREMEKKRIRKLLRSLSYKQGRKYDDPASRAEIQTFINFHQLDMSEVLLPTEQFKNFNEFFYRALKPTARPCSAPDNPKIITSPADCRTVVFNRMQEAQSIWVKGREFTVGRLLGNAYPEDAKRYQGGAMGIFRLAPQDYHRFHIPVDGVMGEPKLIEGEYYTVNPMAIRSALDVYGENVRVIVPIDSVAHGRVMVVCVGAMMVGSTVITRKPGENVRRAEELGYFKFGGSTILLLFEPGVMKFDDDLVDNSLTPLETLIRVGMSIGHTPDIGPHTPDMKKENPSAEERQDAKRRIEGSLAPSTGTSLPSAASMAQ